MIEWPAPESLGRATTYSSGTALLRQEEPFHCLYWIEAGLIRVTTLTAGHHALLAVRRPGWLLGAVPAITGNELSVSATAWSDCSVRPLPLAKFHALRLTEPSVGLYVQRMLALEAEEQAQRAARLAGATVRQRLVHVLRDLLRYGGRRRGDGSVRLMLHMSVTELANLAATSREEASRLLSRFVQEGMLVRDREWIFAPAQSSLLLTQDKDAALCAQRPSSILEVSPH